MFEHLFDSFVHLISIASLRQSLGYQSVLLLTILINYRNNKVIILISGLYRLTEMAYSARYRNLSFTFVSDCQSVSRQVVTNRQGSRIECKYPRLPMSVH